MDRGAFGFDRRRLAIIGAEGWRSRLPSRHLRKDSGRRPERRHFAGFSPGFRDFLDRYERQPLLANGKMKPGEHIWKMVIGTFHELAEELVEPPTVAAITGFVVGAIPWLKSVIIGSNAPLGVIQNTLELLGNGTVPCTTLILGGNLTRGIGKTTVKPSAIVAIALVRYIALPISGIFVVKAASSYGFLPKDPLFSYVLLTQFSLPPAVAIGVMAQLFGVGLEESSVIFLWMYLLSALALTAWSTVFLYLLS